MGRRNPVESDPLAGSLMRGKREILDLIADGCTNRQIGVRLFLAEQTVKNYVSGLLTKLGMQRTQGGGVRRNPAPADRREISGTPLRICPAELLVTFGPRCCARRVSDSMCDFGADPRRTCCPFRSPAGRH
jgi:hypothetical protein